MILSYKVCEAHAHPKLFECGAIFQLQLLWPDQSTACYSFGQHLWLTPIYIYMLYLAGVDVDPL